MQNDEWNGNDMQGVNRSTCKNDKTLTDRVMCDVKSDNVVV